MGKGPTVNLDDEVDHPLADELLDTNLVKGPCLGDKLAGDENANIDCHSLFHVPPMIDHRIDNRIDILGLGFG